MVELNIPRLSLMRATCMEIVTLALKNKVLP